MPPRASRSVAPVQVHGCWRCVNAFWPASWQLGCHRAKSPRIGVRQVPSTSITFGRPRICRSRSIVTCTSTHPHVKFWALARRATWVQLVPQTRNSMGPLCMHARFFLLDGNKWKNSKGMMIVWCQLYPDVSRHGAHGGGSSTGLRMYTSVSDLVKIYSPIAAPCSCQCP